MRLGEKMVHLRCWERETEWAKREERLEDLANYLEEKRD